MCLRAAAVNQKTRHMKFLSFFTRNGKSKESAKNHVENLYEMANIDGHYDPREQELLDLIARRDKVERQVIDRLTESAREIKTQIPEEEDLKFHQFYELVKMMIADEYIHALEMNLIRNWGERFGYNKKHLDELIDAVVQNIKNGQDAVATRKRVNWMLESKTK